MQHELYYDAENELVFLAFKNHYLLSEVEPIFKKTNELLVGKKYRQILVVMNEKYDVENRETREETSNQLSKSNISDIAFVGGSAASRMIAKVLIKTGVVKISGDFFKENEQAINWLKSKR